MLEQFLNHITENSKLVGSNQKIVLAVSGGIDSMVMLDIFRQSSYSIAVAHCNFQLRGKDSDEDEKFVKKICDRFGIDFYTKRFSTTGYAEERKVSIQMAARDLRYSWFDELMREEGMDFVVTAHHLNDDLETVLLNLVRGTGFDGLVGIPVYNRNVVRPFLSFTKTEIEQYAKNHLIAWREDASNQTSDYDRNFIRHQIIPQLKQLNPSLEEGFLATKERLMGAKDLVSDQIAFLKSQFVTENTTGISINIQGVLSTSSPEVVLWYFIKTFGFTFDQCKAMVMPHETGRSFYSKSFRITIDREHFIVTEVRPSSPESVYIENGQQIVKLGKASLSIELTENIPTIERDPTVAMLDADVLEFPLHWRTWQPGDQFVPLGMRQHKKVSDFLIDQKVSLPEKEGITVLVSGGKICWVVGHRISDLFKIKEDTQRAIIIRNIQ